LQVTEYAYLGDKDDENTVRSSLNTIFSEFILTIWHAYLVTTASADSDARRNPTQGRLLFSRNKASSNEQIHIALKVHYVSENYFSEMVLRYRLFLFKVFYFLFQVSCSHEMEMSSAEMNGSW